MTLPFASGFFAASWRPTIPTPLLLDDFNRANAGGWGGSWTIRSGTTATWEIISNAGRNDASASEVIENVAVVAGEMLVQARLFSADYTTSQPRIFARFGWGAGSMDGYNFGPNVAVPGWRLTKFVAGVETTLASGADALVAATQYSAQLYVADGVQQACGNGVSMSAVDTAHDGQNARSVAARKNRISGGQIVTWDDFCVFASKVVTVRDLASGWKAKVLDSVDAEVATATESGGTATVDISRFGGATQDVPVAGWAAVIVTDGADVEQARYSGEIYPGFDGRLSGSSITG